MKEQPQEAGNLLTVAFLLFLSLLFFESLVEGEMKVDVVVVVVYENLTSSVAAVAAVE